MFLNSSEGLSLDLGRGGVIVTEREIREVGKKIEKICLQEAKQGEARPNHKSQVKKMLLGFSKFPKFP